MCACAEAMREEYKAIIDAGLMLQLDDPAIAENWDRINPAPTLEDYQRFTSCASRRSTTPCATCRRTASASTSAGAAGTARTPPTCRWRDIVDVMLQVNAGAYSFEAGNVRHEHEWRVWEDVKLPEGKVLIPGVVSHATNVVEHPELVADRIVRFAERRRPRERRSPRPTAASADASTRRSPGRSSTRCGGRGDRHQAALRAAGSRRRRPMGALRLADDAAGARACGSRRPRRRAGRCPSGRAPNASRWRRRSAQTTPGARRVDAHGWGVPARDEQGRPQGRRRRRRVTRSTCSSSSTRRRARLRCPRR